MIRLDVQDLLGRFRIPQERLLPRLPKGEYTLADSAMTLDVRLPLYSEGAQCRRETRRAAVKLLTIGVCATGRNDYAAALNDALWAITQEDAWGFDKSGLLDIPALETGALLATSVSLAGSAVMAEVAERVRRAVHERIFKPLGDCPKLNFLADDHVERGCLAVLECVAYLGETGSSRWLWLKKTLSLLDAYLRGGGLPGLPPYRETAQRLAALAELLRLLSVTTGATFPLNDLSEEALLLCASVAENGFYVSPGPGGMTQGVEPALLYHIGKHASQPHLMRTAAYLAQSGGNAVPMHAPLSILAQIAAEENAFAGEISEHSVRPSEYFEREILFCARGESLFCAMHGGSGYHADAGDLCLFANGQPILIDLGDTARADWHNVPEVNGVMQKRGLLAKDADHRVDPSYSVLSLSLTDAYAKEARIRSWQRTLLKTQTGTVRLIDMFDMEGTGRADFRFITPVSPKRDENGILLGPVRLTWDGMPLSWRVDSVTPKEGSPFETVYRITLTMQQDAAGGSVTFTFENASNNN